MQFAALFLAFSILVPGAAASERGVDVVRVGLAFGSSALVGANLENNTGYGAGYRFGYYDEDLEFEELGYTDEDVTRISVLKAQNIWFSRNSSGSYVYSNSDNGGTVIGCFHIQIPDSYRNFSAAVSDAEELGGFVAWIDGDYQVRYGAYTSKEDAQAALDELVEEETLDEDARVVGTSSYAVTVIATGSDTILYQHDGGEDTPLGVLPDVTGEDEVRTWCMGYKRHGGFRYERVNGGNLTVSNLVEMEDYIKGVIPYEMSNSWPLEALKAQAVCARSYASVNIGQGKHKSYHIDVCDTACCQVYNGIGSNSSSYQANDRTDEAVEDTAGVYAYYNGSVISAFYSSSHGGASEDVYHVWGSSRETYPYLCGVIDPYEQDTNGINSYSDWTRSYSSGQMLSRLRDYGYCVDTKLKSIQLTYSDLGNVIRAKLNYTNGESNTLSVSKIKSVFGLSSIHFTLNGANADSTESKVEEVAVNKNKVLDLEEELYVISGSGTVSKADKDALYTIGDEGTVSKLELTDAQPDEDTSGDDAGSLAGKTVTVDSSGTYQFRGAGNGHQLGMSQFGAYAMAERGFDYDEIVEFYYPGTYVSRNP